jgi:hypothetical protein
MPLPGLPCGLPTTQQLTPVWPPPQRYHVPWFADGWM